MVQLHSPRPLKTRSHRKRMNGFQETARRSISSFRFRALLPILGGVAFACLCAWNACAPAPKYRSRGPAVVIPARGSVAPDSSRFDLGIRLLAPLRDSGPARITSPFSAPSASSRRHDGVDIKARSGEEVLAAGEGLVVFSGTKRGYGNVVIVDHGGISTLYAHLSSRTVQKGDSIAAGSVIGRAGRHGRATGTHLHFEVLRGGSPIDPVPHLWLDSEAK